MFFIFSLFNHRCLALGGEGGGGVCPPDSHISLSFFSFDFNISLSRPFTLLSISCYRLLSAASILRHNYSILMFCVPVQICLVCLIKFIQFQCNLWCIPSPRVVLSFKRFTFVIISSTLRIFSLECHFLYFYTLRWSYFVY